MAQVTRYPTTDTAVAGSWTNPTNVQAADGSVASTTIAAKSTSSTREQGGYGFDGVIPSGSTINSVWLEVNWRVTTTAGIANLEGRARVGGVDQTINTDSAEPTTLTARIYDITSNRAWTRADLLDASLATRIQGRSGNDATSVTYEFDYIRIRVDYTAPVTDRRGIITFAELETPDAPRRGVITFAELETPNEPRRGIVTFAELETPAAPRRGIITFAELETPGAPRRGIITFAEMETPNPAPSRTVRANYAVEILAASPRRWTGFPGGVTISGNTYTYLDVEFDGIEEGVEVGPSQVALHIPDVENLASDLVYDRANVKLPVTIYRLTFNAAFTAVTLVETWFQGVTGRPAFQGQYVVLECRSDLGRRGKIPAMPVSILMTNHTPPAENSTILNRRIS